MNTKKNKPYSEYENNRIKIVVAIIIAGMTIYKLPDEVIFAQGVSVDQIIEKCNRILKDDNIVLENKDILEVIKSTHHVFNYTIEGLNEEDSKLTKAAVGSGYLNIIRSQS